MRSTQREHCGVLYGAALIDTQAGGFGGRKLLEDHICDDQSGPIYRVNRILTSGHRTGNDVHLNRESGSGHAHWIVDSVLVVDYEFLWQAIHNFATGGKLNSAGRIDGPAHVVGSNLSIATGHGDNRLTVETHDVRSSEIDRDFL